MNLVALAPSVVPQGQSQGNPVGQNPFGYSNYQIGGAITNQGAQYLDSLGHLPEYHADINPG